MSSTTPLMGLILPTVGPGGDAGPTYATLIVDAFTTLDSHNHATGNGAQIGTAGILIDAVQVGDMKALDELKAQIQGIVP